MTNCPNCGAVITGPQCEYCGTRFPNYISPKKNIRHLIENSITIQKLYEEALMAMRAYSYKLEEE